MRFPWRKGAVPCRHEWVDVERPHYDSGARTSNGKWVRNGHEPGKECPRCGEFKATSGVRWEEWRRVKPAKK
jgi:hypothetical protein